MLIVIATLFLQLRNNTWQLYIGLEKLQPSLANSNLHNTFTTSLPNFPFTRHTYVPLFHTDIYTLLLPLSWTATFLRTFHLYSPRTCSTSTLLWDFQETDYKKNWSHNQSRIESLVWVKLKKILDPTFPTMQLVNDPRLSSVFKFPNFVAFEPTPEITPLPSLWHQQGYF